MVFIRTALGDTRTRTPFEQGSADGIENRRHDIIARRINPSVLVCLDRVLQGLQRLGEAASVMQLAAQIFAPIEDERILSIIVTK